MGIEVIVFALIVVVCLALAIFGIRQVSFIPQPLIGVLVLLAIGLAIVLILKKAAVI